MAHACHPGVVRTDVFGGLGGALGLAARAFSFAYLSPDKGAESPLLLATHPRYGAETGRWVTRGFLRGPHPAAAPAAAQDPATGAAVWEALGLLAAPASG